MIATVIPQRVGIPAVLMEVLQDTAQLTINIVTGVTVTMDIPERVDTARDILGMMGIEVDTIRVTEIRDTAMAVTEFPIMAAIAVMAVTVVTQAMED